MFVPFVLPLQLTCVIFAAFILILVLLAPQLRAKRVHVFWVCVGISFLSFLPALFLVGVIVDQYRFGLFTYSEFDDVTDSRARWFLPPTATDLEIDLTASGFTAKYQVTPDQLTRWLDEVWERQRDDAINPEDEAGSTTPSNIEVTQNRFQRVPWEPPPNCEKLEGPRSIDGAGFTIWYDRGLRTAYEHAGYF